VRQLVDHRPSHRETAETGVEDADGGIHPTVGRPVLLHDAKARGWLRPVEADATDITDLGAFTP
jgi:hypothetical protein